MRQGVAQVRTRKAHDLPLLVGKPSQTGRLLDRNRGRYYCGRHLCGTDALRDECKRIGAISMQYGGWKNSSTSEGGLEG